MIELTKERQNQLADLAAEYNQALDMGMIWKASSVNCTIGSLLIEIMQDEMKLVMGENDE